MLPAPPSAASIRATRIDSPPAPTPSASLEARLGYDLASDGRAGRRGDDVEAAAPPDAHEGRVLHAAAALPAAPQAPPLGQERPPGSSTLGLQAGAARQLWTAIRAARARGIGDLRRLDGGRLPPVIRSDLLHR